MGKKHFNLLKQLQYYAEVTPDAPAYEHNGIKMTYHQIDLYSQRIAAFLVQECGYNNDPIVVYGHKHPFMLVLFLACTKAGHAYCPVDAEMSAAEVDSILQLVPTELTLVTRECDRQLIKKNGKEAVNLWKLMEIARTFSGTFDAQKVMGENDTFCIVFKRGSSGRHIGVRISYKNLNHFLDWAVTLGGELAQKFAQNFISCAPFTSDMSLLEVYLPLICGGTIKAVEHNLQNKPGIFLKWLQKAGIRIWISTPDFLEACLASPAFSAREIPTLSLFICSGRALEKTVARQLFSRFPQARVVCTYGVTEACLAITALEVTPQMCKDPAPLPAGYVKDGIRVRILDNKGRLVEDGTPGQIQIVGDTVSQGYYRDEYLTKKVFFTEQLGSYVRSRGFNTSDIGYFLNGLLYSCQPEV